MKRIYFLILLIILTIPLFSNDLYTSNKIKLIELSKSSRILNINKFKFVSIFFEDINFNYKLYEKVSYEDLIRLAVLIYENITHYGGCKLIINNYDGTKDLFFQIYIKYLKDKKNNDILTLMVWANYDVVKKEIIETDEPQENFWGLMYYLVQDKLVNSKYIHGKYQKPSEDELTLLANYYLFDGDIENDKEIENLLITDIKTNKSPSIGFTYIVLSQYYMLVNELEKSTNAINNAKKYIEEEKKKNESTNIDIICDITEKELLTMKELAE